MAIPDRPRWLENAMQGLAFWIGHRRAMFPHYPLAEGALVAEICNLAQVHLNDDQCVIPEVAYSKIAGGGVAGIPPKARADLVLFNAARDDIDDSQADVSTLVDMVVEIKRASAGNALINDDLRRLARLRSANRGIRGFLVVASEAKMPRRFVADGVSKRGRTEIPGMPDWHYLVRRTTKAAASYSALKGQHYICMLEVFRTVTPT